MIQEPTLTVIPIRAVVDKSAATRVIDFQHVAHLADSLREISQFAPIVVRQDSKDGSTYHLWDGAHRLRAAESAGMESVHAKVLPSTVSDAHMRRCVLECEFTTREDSWAIRALKLQELKSLYEQDYPHVAQGKWKRDGKSSGAAPAFVKHIMGESGVSKSTIGGLITLAEKLGETVLRKLDAYKLPQNIGQELKDEKSLPTEEARIPVIERIHAMTTAHKSGRKATPSVATALDAMRKEQRAQECAEIKLTSDDAKVVNTKMQDYRKIPDGSIDAIITDPLYHGKHLALYGVAGRMSAKVLKPGGFASFYCGRVHVEKAMSLLGKYLKFRANVTLYHKQHFGNIGSTKLSTDCKHILVYQNWGDNVDFYESLKGVIEGTGLVKYAHEYQQNTSDLDNLIDATTNPGDVILDMFAGSGTTGVAAILKSRRTILLEQNETHCDTCESRLADALNQSKVISLHPKVQQFMAMFDGHPSREPAALRTAM